MNETKKTISIDESRLNELLAKVAKLDEAAAKRTAYNLRRNAERTILLRKAAEAGITASEDEVQTEMKRMSSTK